MGDNIVRATFKERRALEQHMRTHSDLIETMKNGKELRRWHPDWGHLRVAQLVNPKFTAAHSAGLCRGTDVVFKPGKAKPPAGDVTRAEFEEFARTVNDRLAALEGEVFEV